jgi:ATP-dependent RNA helicase SUPV3L1/SUV3
VPTLPSARRLAKPIEVDPGLPPSFYAAIGFRLLDGLALRPDRLERLAAAARRLARQGPFPAGPELAAIAGVEPGALRGLLAALNYRRVIDAGRETFVARPQRRREPAKPIRRVQETGEGHPFAKLRGLKLA